MKQSFGCFGNLGYPATPKLRPKNRPGRGRAELDLFRESVPLSNDTCLRRGVSHRMRALKDTRNCDPLKINAWMMLQNHELYPIFADDYFSGNDVFPFWARFWISVSLLLCCLFFLLLCFLLFCFSSFPCFFASLLFCFFASLLLHCSASLLFSVFVASQA